MSSEKLKTDPNKHENEAAEEFVKRLEKDPQKLGDEAYKTAQKETNVNGMRS